jgi:hypothetical protein
VVGLLDDGRTAGRWSYGWGAPRRALARFLRALGVPAGSLPLEVGEAAALCRKPPRRPIGPARTRQVLRRETKTEASGAGLPLPDICIAA